MSLPSILIVEDEAIVAADLAGKLEQCGYPIAGSVTSGEAAVALVRQQPPDLVLMDIRLAGAMDGIAAADAIRRECDLPVVFLTAHSDTATLERAKLAEPFGYIIKPFEEREVRTTIEMALYKHQADRQVREQREWFRVTLASIGDAVIACDTESRVTFINPAAETVTGWTTEEVLGQPIQRVLRLIDEQTRQPGGDPVARVLREGHPVTPANHTALITRDGREVPIEDSAAPILDAAGRAIGAVLVFHDVTEKRRAEEALGRSREDLAHAQAVAHTGSWRLDVARNELLWSDETHRIFGIPKGTPLTYETFLGAAHPEDRGRVDEKWTAALRGEPYEVEHRIVVGEQVKWVRERAELEFDPDGSLRAGFGTVQDVTGRRQVEEALQRAHDELEVRVEQRTHDLAEAVARLEAEVAARIRVEAELREAEERYRTLFAAAPVGIALTDASGRVHDANAALCAMFGVTLTEAQASNAKSFYTNPAERRRLMSRVRRETRVEDFEVVLRRKDGTQFVASVGLTWIQLRQQQLFLTLVTDLTRRRQAERHIQGISALQELFVTQVTREEYLQAVAHFLSEWAGCASAGVRLLDPEGRLPFVVSVGFTRAFLKEEGQFCLGSAPCPCLPALTKRSGAMEAPYARIQGTIFRNDHGDLLERSTTTGAEWTTMPCVKARYASVAHAPIYYRDRFLGIIQLADRQDNRVPLETAQFLDSAAPLVGEALHRFSLESELRESEERFRSLFECHEAVMLLVDPESGAIVDANEAAERFYGFPRGRLTTLSLQELSVQPPSPVRAGTARGAHGQTKRAALVQRLANGETRTVEVHSSSIAVRERLLQFSIIHDITERRRLERQVLDIGDRERQRIGRDLHDSLGGSLSGLAMLSKALAQSLTRSSIAEASIAEEIVQGINEAVGRTRAIARGLCPIGLSSFGFVNGLEELARSVEKRHQIRCRVRAPQDVAIEEDLVASHLFQIVQEAVNNAVRHGQPRAIEITVDQQPTAVSLSVRDDGGGLPKDVERSPGMGLRTMRYRAGVIGAALEIQSPPTGGTLVTCLVAVSNPPSGTTTPTPARP